ncbi:tungsten formylmethanofuran dehydrogenase [Hymenobacter sp. BT186]|uniref:3-methyl-2-oxobutanoate dehydrogenase (2-methylpropanoyl-transferring) n=1 Tax=Hymenobacter telluris TaxID=2816474 RepID=A0A939EVM2_9BACT|nr:alpha-ketoacid dehydrogenase subunit alpha/beta [Hymenobacter telluris]MBO0358664.1 tungsten formylmethanofuran dehydrogenase [Hymenobacter telluris]MBW3374690.1 tungsten formylmethanofuran dehydrogenase [Hymenobacter norwichensis]
MSSQAAPTLEPTFATTQPTQATWQRAYRLMHTAAEMARLYEENKAITAKYVHATARGHEAVQLAAAFHLRPIDCVAPYYRDDAMLIGLGLQPYELMLQLMAKRDDPFSGGRTYYSHPSLRRKGFPLIPHQSSATGMQAIPATGMAHGIKYLESIKNLELKIKNEADKSAPTNSNSNAQSNFNSEFLIFNSEAKPVVVCSIGDGAMTEGEVSEALQMAVLHQLPIIYLVQDNDWGISATGREMRTMDAYEFAAGFKGLHRLQFDGADFQASYAGMADAFDYVRARRGPVLVHAKCPLLGHHTSGVRREWYRGDNLTAHNLLDPLPRLHQQMLDLGFTETALSMLAADARATVEADYQRALAAPAPDPATYADHEFAPPAVTEEAGERSPAGADKALMVDAALHTIDDILREFPEALFYGQDVGGELGGVFREAALLAKKYGDARVFNTPIQEAYIVGSTAGMSAVGAKAIVEIQFADYIWPGLNQLVEELSKSCYLSNGQFPVQSLIRVPIGAYGGGGPYHSGSIESTLLNIRGIKVVYPSNAADMKGLMRAAFLDPNPVVMLEHKGLYWSKVPGTEDAKTVEPAAGYVIPLGKAAIAQAADAQKLASGETCVVVTYGMGVYWAKTASRQFPGQVEILDLRTLNPLDFEAVEVAVRRHGKALVLTEEPLMNSFAESLAGRIQRTCFRQLDAPVFTLGAANLPAIALNVDLERQMLPNADKVAAAIGELVSW